MNIKTQFNNIVIEVAANKDAWNSRVKKKKYKINDNDSLTGIESKVYRYLNTYEDEWQKGLQDESGKAKYKAAKLYYQD